MSVGTQSGCVMCTTGLWHAHSCLTYDGVAQSCCGLQVKAQHDVQQRHVKGASANACAVCQERALHQGIWLLSTHLQ